MILALVVLIVMFLPFLLTLFFFQAYRSIGLGLTIVLIAGLQLYTGSKQIQAAKGRVESFTRWKNNFIGLGLTFVCFGALECVGGLHSLIRPILESFGSDMVSLCGIRLV